MGDTRNRVGVRHRLPAADEMPIGIPAPEGDEPDARRHAPLMNETKMRPDRGRGHGYEVPNRDEGEKGSHRRLLLLKAVARAREAEAA
jgi:hypothetical protein